MVIFNSYVAMDQYLLIPFLGGWTSINPSYFDVHQRYKALTHCHVTNYQRVAPCGPKTAWPALQGDPGGPGDPLLAVRDVARRLLKESQAPSDGAPKRGEEKDLEMVVVE